MPKVTAASLRQARRAIEDVELLKVIRSEIQYELTSPPLSSSQKSQSGSLGDFEMVWDSPVSKDVVLSSKCKSGEEIVVSALLDTRKTWEHANRTTGLMKVCVKKPGLSSLLLFDCGAYQNLRKDGKCQSFFTIKDCHFLHSTAQLELSNCKAPSVRTLDVNLVHALEQYLKAKGINESLIDFLLQHLDSKEQRQYVNWLKKLELLMGKDE